MKNSPEDPLVSVSVLSEDNSPSVLSSLICEPTATKTTFRNTPKETNNNKKNTHKVFIVENIQIVNLVKLESGVSICGQQSGESLGGPAPTLFKEEKMESAHRFVEVCHALK